MRRAAAALLFVVVAAGCVMRTSQPARLYVLDAVATSLEPAGGAPGAVLGVSRVVVPDWLDRSEMTARTAAGEIAPDEMARWGEPLSRGLQRVLTENLAALLPDRHVVTAPFAPRHAIDHRLEIAVTEAGRQADGTALVEARWGIVGARGAVLVQRRSSHRAGPARDGAATVRALNEALAALSAEIARAVRELPPPAPEASPAPR